MKNRIFIFGLGLLMVSCSASRTGYSYYDDVYNNRPSYSEERRSSTSYIGNTPSSNYNTSNYPDAREYQDSQYNNNAYDDSGVYADDETQNNRLYENYTERLRRFGGTTSGFDYYSPYYTGFYDGVNYGSGTSLNIGLNSWGRYGVSLLNPYFSSSFSLGWGIPYYGLNSLYDPFYYNSFYYPSYSWFGYRGLYDPFYSSFYSPYYYGFGYPYYSYGFGRNNYHYYKGDAVGGSSKRYYGPRGGSYGNQYYDGKQNIGSKTIRGNETNSVPDSRYKGGNMRYTPKNNTNNNYNPSVNPTLPDNRQPSTPSRPNNMPNRYGTPNNINTPTPRERQVSPSVPQNNMPKRYNNATPKSAAPATTPIKTNKRSQAERRSNTPSRYNNSSYDQGNYRSNEGSGYFNNNSGSQRSYGSGNYNSGGSYGGSHSNGGGSGGSMRRTNK